MLPYSFFPCSPWFFVCSFLYLLIFRSLLSSFDSTDRFFSFPFRHRFVFFSSLFTSFYMLLVFLLFFSSSPYFFTFDPCVISSSCLVGSRVCVCSELNPQRFWGLFCTHVSIINLSVLLYLNFFDCWGMLFA